MKKRKFSLNGYRNDKRLTDLVSKASHKTLAVWAIDCAERVLPYFENTYPADLRPRRAIETLNAWLDTGVFRMSVIRQASLSSHAAGRETGEDNPARSSARAAGQAVATAHVPTHSIGSAVYALQAVYRASDSAVADEEVNKEQDWQYQHLVELMKEF